ncbi:MAG: flagella basal body P-ring formation protein FlgA [Candidatus Muiribacterium halophilum]|uniref:Flagella basal body P-ring formation protein FlgA n=1 Tax=Muiribacterium halophilum TaxID=2053465 RepID=A0A2N5ZCF8_MUIH1|nr:MAG: flagella basal body P-ring formation protein FlgA [Candidatus Muirbacterium halophilum]
MNYKRYIVIFLIAFSLIGYTIEFKENIIVKGKDITLGDLLEGIPGDVAKRRVSDTALPGKVKKISVSYVNQLLLRSNISAVDYSADFLDVKTYSHEVPASEITKYMREKFAMSYPVLIGYKKTSVPDDNYIFKMERLGKTRMIVQIVNRDQLYKKIIVRYKETTKCRVLVSKRNIAVGDDLSEKDFSFMDMLVPDDIGELVTSLDDIKHCKAAEDISYGNILLRSMLNYADIVTSGSVIEAIHEGNGFTINMKVRAMESGKINEIIRVKTLNDHRQYTGRVVDENKVSLIF